MSNNENYENLSYDEIEELKDELEDPTELFNNKSLKILQYTEIIYLIKKFLNGKKKTNYVYYIYEKNENNKNYMIIGIKPIEKKKTNYENSEIIPNHNFQQFNDTFEITYYIQNNEISIKNYIDSPSIKELISWRIPTFFYLRLLFEYIEKFYL